MADEAKQEAWRHYSMICGSDSSEEDLMNWKGLRCTGNHETALRVSLSEPGPQYLRFLEEYAFEISVRWEMENPARDTERDDFVDDAGSERFEFMVGNYAVRKYIEKLDALMDGSRGGKKGVIGAGIHVGDVDELESTEKALLWYFGRDGILNCDNLSDDEYSGGINEDSEKFRFLSLVRLLLPFPAMKTNLSIRTLHAKLLRRIL